VPADHNDAEVEWAELEEAVGRRDWVTALELSLNLEREWKTVRGFVEIFAGPGGERWGRLIDKAIAGLLEALGNLPVDPAAVDAAMSRFRMFMR